MGWEVINKAFAEAVELAPQVFIASVSVIGLGAAYKVGGRKRNNHYKLDKGAR